MSSTTSTASVFITPHSTALSKAQAFAINPPSKFHKEYTFSPLPRTSSRKIKENALASPFSSRPCSPAYTKYTYADVPFTTNTLTSHSTTTSPTRQAGLFRRPSEPNINRPSWSLSASGSAVAFDRPPSQLDFLEDLNFGTDLDFSLATQISTPKMLRNAFNTDSDSSEDDLTSWQTDSLISPPSIYRKGAYINTQKSSEALEPPPPTSNRRTRSGTITAKQPPNTKRTRSGTVVRRSPSIQKGQVNGGRNDTKAALWASKATSDDNVGDESDDLNIKGPWIDEPLFCAPPPSLEVNCTSLSSLGRKKIYERTGRKLRSQSKLLTNDAGPELSTSTETDLEDDPLLLK